MNFIVNTITGWDEPPRARHQLTSALNAAGHKVVFVCKNLIGKPSVKIIKDTGLLQVVQPVFPVDYRLRYRIPGLNEFYQYWLFSRLSKKYPDHVVVNFDFTAFSIFRYFDKVVYYCNDEYIGNSRYPTWIVNQYHAYCEKRVARDAIFCVSTADFLTRKLSKYNPRVCQIPLGAPDLSSLNFKPGMMINKQVPVTVGLVGFISTRNISTKVINALASDDRFRLVLVGPVEEGFMRLLDNPETISFKGVLKGKALYAEIDSFDVAIAPYNLEKINPGTTPNKLWQYLALGKPVVVSDLPNIYSFNIPEKQAYITSGENEFGPLILKAIEENSLGLAQDRVHFAMENSWNKRARQFLTHLEPYVHTP